MSLHAQAVTTAVGLEFGLASSLFAVALCFTLVTMYDAAGVRYHSGEPPPYSQQRQSWRRSCSALKGAWWISLGHCDRANSALLLLLLQTWLCQAEVCFCRTLSQSECDLKEFESCGLYVCNHLLAHAAGKQAEVLNILLKDVVEGHPVSEQRLKEVLGHTPVQVHMPSHLNT